MSLPVPNSPVPRTALDPVCPALAAVIRQQRLERGLSLTQLAERTRLSRRMLTYIETCERVPTVDTVARISRAFGVQPSELLAVAQRVAL